MDNEIAVVGLACCAAGGSNTTEKLWQALMDKTVSSGEVPDFRWEPCCNRDPITRKVSYISSPALPSTKPLVPGVASRDISSLTPS